ncbi:MAG: hypothetical protein RL669_1791, partial [Pseudomonadota bacterium]
ELDAARARADISAQRAALRGIAQQHWERVYQGLVQDDWAEHVLHAAHDAGLGRASALPYWAELRFRQSRPQEVAALLRELGPAPAAGPLAAVQRFWSA